MHKGESRHINHLSQQELVVALKTDNKSVMEKFYYANYKKVNSFIVQNSGTASDAQDIYQEAFLSVWQNVKNSKFKSKGESSLSGYLFRIAKNKWIDYLRSSNRKKMVLMRRIPFDPNDDSDNAEKENREEEQLINIMQAFNQLEERCQFILRSFYFNEKSHRQIARELGMKETSVRNQKYRCIQKLRATLNKT